nr:hypothetical protein [Bifidobacterium catenulatum]
MTDKQWKILLAVAVVLAAVVIGFNIGIGVGSSSSTVYSTDPAQCPTDATFCQSVNIWRRSDAADSYQPNANNKRSSAYIDA